MKGKITKKILITAMTLAVAMTSAIPMYAAEVNGNAIAVEDKIAETVTEGRSLYVGVNAPLDTRSKVLDKLGYMDNEDVDPSDIAISVVAELVEDDDSGNYIEATEDLEDVLTIKADALSFSREGIFKIEVTVDDDTTSVLIDVGDELLAYVDINDWVVPIGASATDFMDEDVVTYDDEKIKSIEVDASNIDLSKEGSYLLTYTITAADDETTIEKSVIVTVGDWDLVKELTDAGEWTTGSVITFSPGDTSKSDKKAPTPQTPSYVKTPSVSTPATGPEDKAPSEDPGTDIPDVIVPETDASETTLPDVPDNDAPETSAPETEIPETSVPETPDVPETEHEHKYDMENGVVTVEPTCTTPGMITYSCIDGDGSKTEEIPATGHSFDDGAVTVEPTCDTAGVMTYTCSVCGETKTEDIPATGHIYDEGVVTTEPTCDTAGVMTYTCSVCGYMMTEEIPATGHDYRDEITLEATCGTDGILSHICVDCGHTETEVIPATGDHHYDSGVITTAPTCGADGVMTYTCGDCGASYTEVIPATGQHTYGEGIVTKQPTCTAEGVMTYTCNVCGATKTESIPVVEHSWVHHDATSHYETVVVEEAWTERKAIWKEVCNQCGEQFDTTYEAGLHIAASDSCYNWSSKIVGYENIYHPAVTEQVQVEDTPAYDECSVCGVKK